MEGISFDVLGGSVEGISFDVLGGSVETSSVGVGVGSGSRVVSSIDSESEVGVSVVTSNSPHVPSLKHS